MGFEVFIWENEKIKYYSDIFPLDRPHVAKKQRVVTHYLLPLLLFSVVSCSISRVNVIDRIDQSTVVFGVAIALSAHRVRS